MQVPSEVSEQVAIDEHAELHRVQRPNILKVPPGQVATQTVRPSEVWKLLSWQLPHSSASGPRQPVAALQEWWQSAQKMFGLEPSPPACAYRPTGQLDWQPRLASYT
jgi:hypothetical protein